MKPEQRTNRIIGKNIKRLRRSMRVKGKKVTQERFGKILGLHQTALCRVENGLQNLTPHQIKKAAKFLGVKADWLLGE